MVQQIMLLIADKEGTIKKNTTVGFKLILKQKLFWKR